MLSFIVRSFIDSKAASVNVFKYVNIQHSHPICLSILVMLVLPVRLHTKYYIFCKVLLRKIRSQNTKLKKHAALSRDYHIYRVPKNCYY